MTEEKIYTCDNRGFNEFDPTDAGYFLPINVGALSNQQTTIDFTEGMCFKSIKFTYQQTGEGEDIGDVILTIDTEKANSLFCKDWFFFATTEMYHVETFSTRGSHQVQFKGLTEDAKADIRRNGVRVYMFCDGYVDTFISVFNTLLAFVGGLGTDPNAPIYSSHVPEYMEKENIAFLHELMGYDLVEREVKDYEYDPDLI